MAEKPKPVREQVVVYLEPRDRELLERLARETGLSRTELLRRGLWQLAGRELAGKEPGGAFNYLVKTASDADIPADLSARPDYYLYGGGYEKHAAKVRKRVADK